MVALDAVIGAAVIPEILIGATSESVTGWDEPFSVAVTVTFWSESTAIALAVNVPEMALAARLTEDGTVNNDGALPDSATTVLAAVSFEMVTVQMVLPFEVRLATAHWRVETVTGAAGATSEIVAAADEPFSAA